MCWQAAKFKNQLWHFEIFLNTGPYGSQNFKMLPRLPANIHPISSNLMRTLFITGIQAITFLAIGQVLKMFVALGKSNMGVNGESNKMCNALKKADRRAKQKKIWDSRS